MTSAKTNASQACENRPPLRQKKCRACGVAFQPVRAIQVACSIKCAVVLAAKKRAKREAEEKKAQNREIRAAKERMKSRSTWMKEAQAAFNRYIRLRDADKPCICCGLPLSSGDAGGDYDCGHYRSVGSAPHLRFDERNAHGQRKQCNRWGSGRAVDYRIGLIRRIGLQAVEELEADQSTKKYTIDDLREIKRVYSQKAKEILK